MFRNFARLVIASVGLGIAFSSLLIPAYDPFRFWEWFRYCMLFIGGVFAVLSLMALQSWAFPNSAIIKFSDQSLAERLEILFGFRERGTPNRSAVLQLGSVVLGFLLLISLGLWPDSSTLILGVATVLGILCTGLWLVERHRGS